MKGTWLGQAGFLFTAENGVTVMIDPYLSNAIEERKGAAFRRQVPVDVTFLKAPDILVLTHCHDDHMDMDTLDILFEQKRMTVLAPPSALPTLRKCYPGMAEYVVFTPGTEITLEGILFRAVFAAHSDTAAIGVVMDCDDRRIYHMGDSLYHRDILREPVEAIDLLILPINGKGNNMNVVDAARMTRALSPKEVLPMHWDMFEAFGCNVSDFTEKFTDKDTIKVRVPDHYTAFDI